ncbi:helix-turn-helix domain-containing protein [Bacteroides uniformis]|jgi:excisionase family DNA binding protein|uniref:DNA-binding protein n=1 Tax=Bacteroides uniformis TaxID=820 RepID=A0A413X8A2_BACUN|nr:helix-turn-helix domain-containing protein [Bacteroides uniformis]RHB72827.1 DNA-binding protein [Bacteroides uniformis]RHI75312.1 DNA-binding protein [Bacteroides uniformis]
MASNIDIQKKCEWCGKLFIAHKTSTRCCSHRCANLAYKERTRQKRVSEFQAMVNQQIEKEDCIDKDFFTPSEAAKYIGISRATFYRYLETNLIKSVQLKRKTIIRKRDIEALFDNASPYKKHLPRSKQSITDFYTIAEIKEKFGVKESWIYEIAKEHNIPRTFSRGRTYWSKKHIDSYFAKKAPDASITEWYSVAELQEKFGMTLSAIYTFVYKNVIPKRKEGKMVYYSKKHFDIAKGIATPEEPQYYTIPEAMEKYNLTRDQLYHYVKYHNITRIKVGKYTKILRSELDKFFEPPKIE